MMDLCHHILFPSPFKLLRKTKGEKKGKILPLWIMLELPFIQVYKGTQKHWACDVRSDECNVISP